MPIFEATILIGIDAKSPEDAADGIHEILEPREQEGHIEGWKYIRSPYEIATQAKLPEVTDALTFAEGEWGEWVIMGTVAGMEQKVRRPLNDVAMNSMDQIAIVALSLHDRIAALEKTGPLELPVQV